MIIIFFSQLYIAVQKIKFKFFKSRDKDLCYNYFKIFLELEKFSCYEIEFEKKKIYELQFELLKCDI